MGDVGAADVEGPGDGVRIGDDQRVGAQLADLGADARELVVRRLAGEAQVMQRDRAERRRRAVGPDRVDQVGLDRDQASRRPSAQALASRSAPSTVCSQGS
mgnify:CR=1 FL=1